MLNWYDIDTVLLDMDGTLLDLQFDNYFWQEFLPMKWGEIHGLDADTAKVRLLPHFRQIEGSLSWYCLDYWSDYLEIDILTLNLELEHLIKIRPHVPEFLDYVAGTGKSMALVTNAHQSMIELKFKNTGIGGYFEHVFCAHDFGIPKEEAGFWSELHRHFPYNPNRTLLIDDNVSVLASARDYGIRHLLAVAQPDSSMPRRDIRDFRAMVSFQELFQTALQ